MAKVIHDSVWYSVVDSKERIVLETRELDIALRAVLWLQSEGA